jgi:Transglutaminase-like superfamily
MSRIGRFCRLSLREKLVLAQAVSLFLAAELCLHLFSLRITRRLFSWQVREARPLTASRLIWAVNRTAACLSFISCMPQAIASQSLFALYGYRAAIRIGVAPPVDTQLQAHAWLEYQGEAVLGASELDRYTILLSLEPEGKTHV